MTSILTIMSRCLSLQRPHFEKKMHNASGMAHCALLFDKANYALLLNKTKYAFLSNKTNYDFLFFTWNVRSCTGIEECHLFSFDANLSWPCVHLSFQKNNDSDGHWDFRIRHAALRGPVLDMECHWAKRRRVRKTRVLEVSFYWSVSSLKRVVCDICVHVCTPVCICFWRCNMPGMLYSCVCIYVHVRSFRWQARGHLFSHLLNTYAGMNGYLKTIMQPQRTVRGNESAQHP